MSDVLLKIDNLIEAIKDKQAEARHLEAIYKAKQKGLEEAYQDKRLGIENVIEKLTHDIHILFEQTNPKETKTQKKLSLLSGDVVLKKATREIQATNKENILKWAIDNDAMHYVKQEPSLRWAELKSNLVIQEGFDNPGILFTDTGEVLSIEGLEVVDKKEQLIVK